MKKLITAIAAIATSFGLFADGPATFAHSVTNDICFKTNNLVVGYNSEGTDSLTNSAPMPVVHWFADSLKTNFNEKIANYEQPELKGEASDQYLAIDTDVKEPVLRTFSAVSLAESNPRSYKYDQVGITDHGVFIDTWTTFTLFDTEPEAPSDSKILVWAKETEADEEAGIAGTTNLMVTCGYFDTATEKTLSTNYVLDVSGVQGIGENGIQPETMYRLTIRADKKDNAAEFRVYLNGTQLKTVELDDGTTPEKFPSMDGGSQQLGAAGFGGTGSLKSVDLLTEADAPDFAADATTVEFTYDTNVTSIVINDRENILNPNTNKVVFTILKDDLATEFTAVVGYKTGYRRHAITHSGMNESVEAPENTVVFKVARYDAGKVAIESELDREGAELWIKLADEENMRRITARPYVKDAIAAISELDPEDLENLDTVKIVLLLDEQNEPNSDFGDWLNISAVGVILDLNGHTMEAVEPWNPQDKNRAIISVGVTMTIMDSSETGGGMIKGIVNDNPEIEVMPIYNNAELSILAAEGTAECKFYGTVCNNSTEGGMISIGGGRFSDISYLKPSEYVTLPEGKEWSATPVDGYYSLVDAGAKTVTITTNPAIGEFNVLTNGEPVVLSGNTATIGKLDPFTVTFTKAAHYNLDDTTDWEYDEGTGVYSQDFEADETAVTLPTGTAITFYVTFANGQNSTITPAAGVSNLVEDTVVAVTATAAENYEFAAAEYTGWTKVDSTTLTKSYEVTKADTVTAPDATAKPVDVTLPQELPTGVTSLVVSQKVNEAWVDVTDTKKIGVGNDYVVVAIPAAGYTIDNPIKSGTAAVGVNISVTKEDVEAKIGKQTFTVTVPELVNFTVAVTNGETEVGTTNGVYTFDYATNVKVAFTAATGYEIKTDTSTNIASLVENVVIAAPTVALKTFTVTFLNEDDSPYAVSNDVPYNTAFNDVKPKVNPTKEGDYTFAGWIPAGEPVISNSTYKATFTLNTYAITWTSENVVATNNGAQVESGITLAAGATITFYPTVGSITNIVVDSVAVDPVVSPFPFTVKAQASVLTVLAGEPAAPSPIPPTQGTVEYSGSGESAVAKITPNPNVTQIDVTPTIGYMGKYEIPSSVTKITGVAISQLIIKTGEYDIAPACKLVNGGEIALDDTKTVSEVPVKPTIGTGVAATDVKPADGAIAVKGIAGLYYALVRGDDPATVGTAGTVKAAEMATVTGAPVSLSDNTAKGTKGFYVIKVSIEAPAIVTED